jgi:hypothetical protein
VSKRRCENRKEVQTNSDAGNRTQTSCLEVWTTFLQDERVCTINHVFRWLNLCPTMRDRFFANTRDSRFCLIRMLGIQPIFTRPILNCATRQDSLRPFPFVNRNEFDQLTVPIYGTQAQRGELGPPSVTLHISAKFTKQTAAPQNNKDERKKQASPLCPIRMLGIEPRPPT